MHVSELEEAVTTVFERSLRVRAGETVLVVADPDTQCGSVPARCPSPATSC